MTFKELYTKAKAETGIETAMVKFKKTQAPPFCIITPDGNEPVKADDKTVYNFNKALFTLTTKKRDEKAKTLVEAFFNNNEIDYDVDDEGYYENEGIYETVYSIIF